MKLSQIDNCKFGIVVFDYGDYKIDKSIESLKNIDYPYGYKIVLSTKNNHKAAELFGYIRDFKLKNVLSEFVISLDERVDCEKEGFLKCMGATHFVKMNSGDQIDPGLLEEVNRLVVDGNEYVAFQNGDVKIIEFNTINDNYLTYNSFDALFDSLKNTSEFKNLDEK